MKKGLRRMAETLYVYTCPRAHAVARVTNDYDSTCFRCGQRMKLVRAVVRRENEPKAEHHYRALLEGYAQETVH